MKWIKKTGFCLLFMFSLGISVSSNAMQAWFSAPEKLDALKDALKSINISDETIEELIKIIERAEQSALQAIAHLTTGLNETIQGSNELKALTGIQRKIELLVKNILTFKNTPKSIDVSASKPSSEKERKRDDADAKAAAHAAELSLSPEPPQFDIHKRFMVSHVQPVIIEIEKALNELKVSIKQRIDAYTKERDRKGDDADRKRDAVRALEAPKDADRKEDAAHALEEHAKEVTQETSTLSSLEDKAKSLNNIIARLKIIQQLLSDETVLSPAVSLPDTLIKELNALYKAISDEINHFKGGLAGVLDDTITGLTEGLNSAGRTISTNIAEDLQRNLRTVLGSSEMINIIENIDTWLKDYDPKNPTNVRKYANKEFINSIATQIEQLEYLFNNINHTSPEKADPRLGEIIRQFKEAITRYQKAIQSVGEQSASVAAPRQLYQAICQINTELLDHVQGTLANIINVLKKVLFVTVDRCTNDLKYNIDQNINHFHTGLRTTINIDLPRTLKKGVGYLTLGTIAACALCHIIWHDRPWQGHLKSIGIATGSIIGMFLVDPVINFWSRRVRAA